MVHLDPRLVVCHEDTGLKSWNLFEVLELVAAVVASGAFAQYLHDDRGVEHRRLEDVAFEELVLGAAGGFELQVLSKGVTGPMSELSHDALKLSPPRRTGNAATGVVLQLPRRR